MHRTDLPDSHDVGAGSLPEAHARVAESERRSGHESRNNHVEVGGTDRGSRGGVEG